jgi:DNA-binding NarL/FixJ family response regulator
MLVRQLLEPTPTRAPEPAARSCGTGVGTRKVYDVVGDETTIRVMLVDDQELLRTGFRMVLHAQPDMRVVAEAGDGAAALAQLDLVPDVDVVLMDVRMPVMDGVEATRRICGVASGEHSRPKVLMLTTFDLDEYAFAALKAGASGFLLKDVPPTELLSAIRAVHSGDAVVAPSTTRRLLDRFVPHLPAEHEPTPATLKLLTDREREVLLHVAQGLSNAEVAEKLFLSEATVKTHVGRILMKLGLRDRVQAVVLAYETGLVKARGI